MPETDKKKQASAKDIILVRRFLYNLYDVAAKHDAARGLSGEIKPEEDLLIKYAAGEIAPWAKQKVLDNIRNKVIEDASSGKEEKKKDYAAIFQDIAGINREDLGTLNYDSQKHNTIIDMVEKYFSTFRPKSRFDPDSEISRMIFRNFTFESHKSGSEIDDFERIALEGIGKKFFGYGSRDVSMLIDEMHYENALMKVYSENPKELKAEVKEGLEKKVQDRANQFIRFVKYALADNIMTKEEDAILRELGMYLGLREEETYQNLIKHARSEIEKDKKDTKIRVLVLNHDPYYTGAIKGRLKNSVFDLNFLPLEKIASEKGAYEKVAPHIVFVDPIHEEGKNLIKRIKEESPETRVYALASRGRLEQGTEADRAKEIGADGYFHVQKMFPGVTETLKKFYAEYKSRE